MDHLVESGLELRHLNAAADNIVGETTVEMRFCPWCGWEVDKIRGITKHREQHEERMNAESIGATLLAAQKSESK